MPDREINCERKDGKVIRGKLFTPSGKDRYPLVIFSHGFGSCYRELQHHAREFTDGGIGCLFFDFCGGGLESTSDGRFDEMTVLTEKEDLLTVMREAQKMPEVISEQIFLAGESQGGFVSALVAAEVPEEVRGLILWYPAFVIPEDAKRRLAVGGYEAEYLFGQKIGKDFFPVSASLDSDEVIHGYRGPVLILQGDKDELVPLSSSQHAEKEYFDAKLIIVHGAGHGFDGEDSREAGYLSRDFVLECLKQLLRNA